MLARAAPAGWGGPATAGAAGHLLGQCAAHWADGRQQCSALSLTGRPCVELLHVSAL